VDPSEFEKLYAAIAPYGIDEGGTYIDGPIGMAYRAFHTTLESRRERQPHKSSCGTVFTWDGRLDNREELMNQLSGDLAADSTDLAIVVAAFDRWGTNCFGRLVGDWAITIWIPEHRELIFVVDFMAIRHIFYHTMSHCVRWSTDLTTLVQLSDEQFHLDEDYLAGYFANDPDTHLTPYREIRQVPAGHCVRIGKGLTSVERFWRFKPTSRLRYKTDVEYEEHFRQVFRQAVRRRLRSDSPILGELSGGLDSSSIICVADDLLAKETVQTARLDTLSYYDATEPDGDDSIYFPKIEEKRGRIGAHINAGSPRDAATSLECIEFSGMPADLGRSSKLDQERAAIVQQGGYRAILSGIGGDEFMGGVPDPSAQLADLLVQFRLPLLAKQLMAWSLVKRVPCLHLLCRAAAELLPNSASRHLLKQARIEPWVERKFASRTGMAIRQLDVDEHFGLWLPSRRSSIASVALMANRMAKGTTSRLALEEPRYPYLDRSLVEFVLSIPASQLLRPGERRSLMRRALAGTVPREILARSTKQIGARAYLVMLERNWKKLECMFSAPISTRFGYIDHERFLQHLVEAKAGKETHVVRMLKTISLELWLCDLERRRLLKSSAALGKESVYPTGQ
jgi:asparagine synthase (glutamine-hydrolysing)